MDPGSEVIWNKWSICSSKLKPVYGCYDYFEGWGLTCLGDDKKWLNSRPMVRNRKCFYFSPIVEERVQLPGLWATLKSCSLHHWSWGCTVWASELTETGTRCSWLKLADSVFGVWLEDTKSTIDCGVLEYLLCTCYKLSASCFSWQHLRLSILKFKSKYTVF